MSTINFHKAATSGRGLQRRSMADRDQWSRLYAKRSAFTLIELLLVLVILAVLAAIVVPKFTGRTQEAKITAAKTQIDGFKTSLSTYENDNGSFPTNDQGLAALTVNPSNLPNWHKLMDNVPNDPWGNPYVYRFPGSNGKDYDIISYGPDGHEGGNDDISN